MEKDATAGDFIGRVAHDDVSEGGFPCSVSTHDDVDFSAVNFEVQTLDDGCAFYTDVEIFNA